MGEGLRQRFRGVPLVTREEDNDELFDSDSFCSDSEDGDTLEDRTRHPLGNSSETTSVAPRLTEQPPVKRGLSKYYQGKSQSFTSLAEVSCVEDLPKKEMPSKRRSSIKPCKMKTDQAPAAGGPCPCSRATPKRTPPRVSSCAALVSGGGSRPPPFPTHRNLCLR